jgi:antitoxin (DNA-binding transcriptional repressor) of toxin-antitoxin stability system
MAAITLTELRADLYKVVDQIIKTGVPVVVQRNGHLIKIVLADGSSKLERLTQKSGVINCDPEDIVHCDWFQEWSELKDIK